MERTSASTLSLVTYLIPVVATVLGVIVLHEQLGWNTYLGYALIILGAMVVNGVIGLAGWRSFGRSWRRAPISS
jgi:drug/metabolite transporter (DMT)-like permease